MPRNIVIKLPKIVQKRIKNPTFALRLKKFVSRVIEFEMFEKTITATSRESTNAKKLKTVFMLIIHILHQFYN